MQYYILFIVINIDYKLSISYLFIIICIFDLSSLKIYCTFLLKFFVIVKSKLFLSTFFINHYCGFLKDVARKTSYASSFSLDPI